MPSLTRNDINRLLREDPNVTDISQGDDPMGGHIDAVLSDGRAVERLMRALQDWEREGGLAVGRPVTSGHTAPPSPPEEYAYRWHNRIGPGWHIEYRSTAVDRDLAMRRKTDEGYFTQRIEEDPTVLYEEHRKAACLRAGRILARRCLWSNKRVRRHHQI